MHRTIECQSNTGSGLGSLGLFRRDAVSRAISRPVFEVHVVNVSLGVSSLLGHQANCVDRGSTTAADVGCL